MGERYFSTVDHLQAVKEENIEVRKTRDGVNDVKLKGIVKDLGILDRRLLLHDKQMGYWIDIQGTKVTCT